VFPRLTAQLYADIGLERLMQKEEILLLAFGDHDKMLQRQATALLIARRAGQRTLCTHFGRLTGISSLSTQAQSLGKL
jgi:hypothetical protein